MMKKYVTPHFDFLTWNQDVITTSGLDSIYDVNANEDIVDVGDLYNG